MAEILGTILVFIIVGAVLGGAFLSTKSYTKDSK